MIRDRPVAQGLTGRFPPFRYMRWAKSHIPMGSGEGAAYYLAGSGLGPPNPDELPLSPAAADLQHAGYDMPPEARRRLAGRYGLADEEGLMLTLGTSHAFHLLCASTLSPGDRCLVERPAYEMLVNLPRLFGASVGRFERRFEDGWRLPEDLPDQIRRERPAMVLLSNPHNPSGVMLDLVDLTPIVEVVTEVQGVLAVDEVYLEYTDDPVGRSAVGLADGAFAEQVAIASSFTKAYGLGTVRFGWLVASPPRIEAARLYNDYISVLYPNPGAWVGLAAMDHLEALSSRARAYQDRGRAIVQAWVDARDDVAWVPPDAGIIGFPRLRPVEDTHAFVDRLHAEHGTLVVPGEFFGAPGHVRLGFGVEETVLREGLTRIGLALDAC